MMSVIHRYGAFLKKVYPYRLYHFLYVQNFSLRKDSFIRFQKPPEVGYNTIIGIINYMSNYTKSLFLFDAVREVRRGKRITPAPYKNIILYPERGL